MANWNDWDLLASSISVRTSATRRVASKAYEGVHKECGKSGNEDTRFIVWASQSVSKAKCPLCGQTVDTEVETVKDVTDKAKGMKDVKKGEKLKTED